MIINRPIPCYIRLIALITLIAVFLPLSAASGALRPVLADPPHMPERPVGMPAHTNLIDAGCTTGSLCYFLPLVVTAPTDPRSRQYAVSLFNNAYIGSAGVTPGWNGDVGSCVPGTTTQAFRDSVLLRLNYYREMAGLARLSGFNADYNTQDQAAALIMAANQALNHNPPSSWKCYTQAGYDGASSSNLALGAYGPSAIDLYMDDGGVASLGHRRWIMYPQTQQMGTGDIASGSWQTQSNALKAWDAHIWDSRPPTRDDFVAWPPATFVPYQVVYPIWSFAVAGADFSSVGVTLTTNGASVGVTITHPANGYGENTLAFTACNCSTWPQPTGDTTYQVTISNVVVNGVTRNYTYTVTVIDPAK